MNELRFAVIGAQKSASTSVQRALRSHPSIFMPRGETIEFESPYYAPERVERLERLLKIRARGRAIGIKRPNYLCLPEVPERLALHQPCTALVVVLRNPIDRALSAYFHYLRFGHWHESNPNVGLMQLLEEVRAGSDRRATEILKFGLYGRALERWLEFFPKHRMLIVYPRQLQSPMTLAASLCTHIGVPPRELSFARAEMAGAYNESRLRLWRKLHPVLFRDMPNGHALERNWLLSRGFGYVDSRLLARLFTSSKPKLDDAVVKALQNYFESDLSLLESIFPGAREALQA